MTSPAPEETPKRVIRDLAFAKRLEQACLANPSVPTDEYRGKKKWVYDKLGEQFGIKASPEAVRKWFTGEARPRPQTMSALAQLLTVDEAWLSLGITAEIAPEDKGARNALADGVVNVVAGFIQMSGGHVAFPTGSKDAPDLTTIIGGNSLDVEVKVAHDMGGNTLRFRPRAVAPNRILVGVVAGNVQTQPTMLLIDSDTLEADAQLRGDYYEIIVERRGNKFWVGNRAVPVITDFAQLVK